MARLTSHDCLAEMARQARDTLLSSTADIQQQKSTTKLQQRLLGDARNDAEREAKPSDMEGGHGLCPRRRNKPLLGHTFQARGGDESVGASRAHILACSLRQSSPNTALIRHIALELPPVNRLIRSHRTRPCRRSPPSSTSSSVSRKYHESPWRQLGPVQNLITSNRSQTPTSLSSLKR